MLIEVAVNKKLPRHQDFDSETIARKFWQLTFVTGRNYVYGRDAVGGPVLVPHEREKEGYQRRKQITKPRNHAGPIIRRYNNHVFRVPAQRPDPKENQTYAMLLEDADGKGTSLPVFMSKVLQEAQIDRDSFILCDSTKDADSDEMTKAQADEAGVRPIMRLIDADFVVNWCEYDGAMKECIIVFQREDGSRFARQYDDSSFRDIELKIPKNDRGDNLIVESIGPEQSHNYPYLPVVRVRPFDGESQIAPLAESQQAITNLLSLLMEEIYNVTFSQMVMTGVSATDISTGFVGNNRTLCLPNPASSMMRIGADPAQAATISQFIMDEQKELYRIAGITENDPSSKGQPESGIAKAFKHNDLSANLAALAECIQEAENMAIDLILDSQGENFDATCKYPDDFDLPNIADDMTELVQVLTLQSLPKTIKQKMVSNFAQEHLSLDEQEQSSFKQELQTIGDDPLLTPMRMPGT